MQNMLSYVCCLGGLRGRSLPLLPYLFGHEHRVAIDRDALDIQVQRSLRKQSGAKGAPLKHGLRK